MIVGDARVSTTDQNLALQRDALKAAGCKKVFTDQGIGGSISKHPGLDAALTSLRPGDSLPAWKLLRRAQSADDPILIMSAQHSLGACLFSMGELLRAREHLDAAISLYDFESHRGIPGFVDPGVAAMSIGALILWDLGYPDQALKRSNEALALAQALSHPHSLAFSQGYACGVHHSRRESRAAQETADIVVALSIEHGLLTFLPAAACHYGWVLAQQGRIEEGISQLQDCLVAARAAGMGMARTFYLCTLTETLIDAGRLDDALSALTEALTAADKHEERDCVSEIHRLKGELLLNRDFSDAGEAQRCFEKAMEIARKQSAKSYELRSTMSLARLLASQGCRDEARTMLAEIYKWFTEGFDTADLKDAKALLDELSE